MKFSRRIALENRKIYFSYLHEKKEVSIVCNFENPFEDENLIIFQEIIRQGRKIHLVLKIIPKKEITIQSLFFKDIIYFSRQDKIFLNGYQSWTESREFGIFERLPGLSRLLRPLYSKHLLTQFGDYSIFPYKARKGFFHGYTYTYIKKSSERFIFYGSLNETNGLTIFQYHTPKNTLYIVKDCAGLKLNTEYKAFDILIAEGTEEWVFSEYFTLLNIKPLPAKPSTGWTSWYNYYTKISEEIILSNLKAFVDKKVPIDIFQIDDGYQKAVGDWLSPNTNFPKGMKYIADEIKKAGYKAGLWLAPFICDSRSDILKYHRDWILKDKKGDLVPAGCNIEHWGGPFYVLDFYNPEVLDYIRKIFHTVLYEWGFDMVKLDFLYAVCIQPREDKTRGEIMAEAMGFLRKISGNKIILGCGVPLASAFGLVEYCRIGSDVSLSWEHRDATIVHYRERVSTINAIVSTIGRRHLDGHVFLNDPDVFILRKNGHYLTEEMQHTLFLINLIFGSLIFTSDNIGEYTEEELKIYLSIFPLKQKKIKKVETLPFYKNKIKTSIGQLFTGVKPYEVAYRIDFEIDNKQYVCFANLGHRRIKINFEKGFYYDNYKDQFIEGDSSIFLEPYSTRCYSKTSQENFEILGSTGHVFAGCDVEYFSFDNKNIRLELCKNPKRRSCVYIKIPSDYKSFLVNGKNIECSIKRKNFNILQINFD